MKGFCSMLRSRSDARLLSLFHLAIAVCLAQSSGFSSDDVLSYVDPLIGTDNGGNVFAGATLRKSWSMENCRES